MCNWGLFGTLTVQVCEFVLLVFSVYHSLNCKILDIFYISSEKGRPLRKALVAFIFLLEIIQTVMATHDIFAALASGWGTPGALDHIYWSCVDVPIMSSIRTCRHQFPQVSVSDLAPTNNTSLVSCTIQLFNAWRIYVFSKSRLITLSVVIVSNKI